MISNALQLRRLLANRYLAPAELRALQERKMRAVIRHAYDNVPYYRSLFRSAGLSPEDINTVEDLRYVPVTTKEDLRAAGVERATARGVTISSCRKASSSGTTGRPFDVYFDHRETSTQHMVRFRALLTMGFRPRDRLCVVRPASCPPGLLGRLGLYRMELMSSFLPIEEQIRYLQRTQPTMLRVGPTQLRAILHRVGYRLSAIVRPRALITSGEVFDEGLKQRIRADLDVEMFNFYISMEFGEIAGDCPKHEGLHVNADQLILECLDDADQRVEPEKPGLVVLTSLFGFAMPLIRYRLGDISALTTGRCSCGSSFPLIAPPRGRRDDVVGLPSGNILSAIPLFVLVNRVDGVEQYRFIQERADQIVLQMVLYEHPGEQALSEMRARLLEYLGEPVRLDIQVVDSIEDEARKFRKFISLVHGSDSRE